MLEENVGKVEVEIPIDIIKEMQDVDLKKIYNELPNLIEMKKKISELEDLLRKHGIRKSKGG